MNLIIFTSKKFFFLKLIKLNGLKIIGTFFSLINFGNIPEFWTRYISQKYFTNKISSCHFCFLFLLFCLFYFVHLFIYFCRNFSLQNKATEKGKILSINCSNQSSRMCFNVWWELYILYCSFNFWSFFLYLFFIWKQIRIQFRVFLNIP